MQCQQAAARVAATRRLARRVALAPGLLVGVALLIARPADAEQIKLANGDILTVQLVEVTTDHVTFVHPTFGSVTVPRNAVEILPPAAVPSTTPSAGAAPPASAAAPAGEAAAPAAPAAPAAEGAAAAAGPVIPPPPPPPPKDWKFKFTFAGSGSAGNSENVGIVTKFTATRAVERAKDAFDAGYWFNSQNGESSENKFTIGGRHEWLFPGQRYFFFGDARFDYDDFNSWLYRLTGHVGAGYRLIEPPKLALNGLVGIGFIKEWKGINDDWRPEALAGIDGKIDIAKNHAIVFKSYFYPSLSDSNSFTYRWVNGIAWSWKIDRDNGLALTAGIDDEYQSDVAPDRDHNDLRVYAGIDWEF
ncbi:MAG: DUF481 domain-containing protein [Phycisphaerales bacterium]